MPRTSTHVIETTSKDYIRNQINSYYGNGDALVREWNERDYGIDFVVELFDNGIPTGNIAYLQIKATSKHIEKNKQTNDVSCANISASSLDYAKQKKIPFVLLYVSICEPREFYFVDLQSFDVNNLIKRANCNESKSVTVRIPIKNRCTDNNLDDFFQLIKSY